MMATPTSRSVAKAIVLKGYARENTNARIYYHRWRGDVSFVLFVFCRGRILRVLRKPLKISVLWRIELQSPGLEHLH